MLRTLPGYLHAKSNNSKNLLLRKPPDTQKGLVVEVFVESQPILQYEHAGLVWYYDDDHYVALWREKTKEQTVLMVHEQEAKPRFAEAKCETEVVWLRLVLSEGTGTSFYRTTDQEEWKKVGQFDLPVKGEPRVGIASGGGPKDAEGWVRFSRFRILEKAD